MIWCFEGLVLQGQPAQNVQMASSLVSDNAVSPAGGVLSRHAGGHGGGSSMRTSKERYTMAKKAAWSSVTVTSIIANFGAHDFVHHLSAFIDLNQPVGTKHPATHSTFEAYKQVQFSLPLVLAVLSKRTIDTVQAVKSTSRTVTSQGIMESSPGHFSTVLVQEGPRDT